ncbi:hypothetical protein [Piscinibacter sp.]|uniref:hypothetical protein n=1 Tax=Piscinibacter sp. TaxID=1903157 RepID=UPI002F42954A
MNQRKFHVAVAGVAFATTLVIALTLCYLLVAEAAKRLFYRLSRVKPAPRALPTMVPGTAR